jgi:hypothetical protein
LFEETRVVGDEGINTDDLMTAVEQFSAEMGTDKAGCAGDKAY